MSLATLNVWVTAIGDPCHIGDTIQWFVHIVDCEGNPLTWCGKSYRDLPTECGHLEVQIPPGCYAVFASEDPAGEGFGEFGNHLTHIQIVRANCCDHVCVTLFSPSAHLCGAWFGGAVLALFPAIANLGVDRQLITGALEAVRSLVAVLPANTFTTNLEAYLPAADKNPR
jgi:hypothetical protein